MAGLGWPKKKRARGYGASLKHSASQRAEGKSIPLWRGIASKLIYRPEPVTGRVRDTHRHHASGEGVHSTPYALLRSTHRALYRSDQANAIETRPTPPASPNGPCFPRLPGLCEG